MQAQKRRERLEPCLGKGPKSRRDVRRTKARGHLTQTSHDGSCSSLVLSRELKVGTPSKRQWLSGREALTIRDIAPVPWARVSGTDTAGGRSPAIMTVGPLLRVLGPIPGL